MNTFLNDLRYAARMLRSNLGFTLVAVLTLAFGIGANTAIFSVVNAVVLRPLPFPKPEQIVIIRDDLTGRQIEDVGMSVDELKDLQERSGVFEQVSAVWPVDANLTGSERPERIELLAVSPNYFALLGAHAQLGRVFGPEEQQAKGFAEGVVISDGLWKRLYGSDRNILGRKVYADTDLYTIIGVMPPEFRHPGKTLRNEVDMWATAGFSANPFGPPVRAARMLPGAIGRLKDGTNIEQAQGKLDSLVAQLQTEFPKEYPPQAGWTVRILSAHQQLVGNVQTILYVVLAAVGLVLLIGCVNLANLMLARSSGRRREMAIRLALGASRRRLIVQLLTESLLLSFIGGALALVVLAVLLKGFVQFIPSDIPRLHEIGINLTVLGFVFLISTVTGLLFGLFPAMQSSRPDVVSNLKDGSHGAGFGLATHRFRSGLVVLEFALSLILMIAAGLLLRSFGRLLDVNPGFNPDNVLLTRVWLPVPNNPELDPYRDPLKRAGFIKELQQRVSSIPGVRNAAISSGNAVPLVGPHNSGGFTIEGDAVANNAIPTAQIGVVSPDYFRTIETPLKRGRFFTDADDRKAPQVVLIDEALEARYFSNRDPVGLRIKRGGPASDAPWMTIVGIVGNIKSDGFDKPDQPHLYHPIFQNPAYAMAIYMRSDVAPLTLTQSVREQVRALDRDLPVFGERTMSQVAAESMSRRRFAMQLVGLFGILALLLAAVGIYGVIAYSVTQRTREIGIRVALGASRSAILRWVLRQGMILSIAGVVIGLVGALALTRLLRTLLFGVGPTDIVTYGALALLMTIVALIACYVPARRATKVDPLVALRYE
ncbi:MAG TPA: ABC transporter permease [Pyrinomonadaceae bacterium]|nr:ABC transporter permease [Pyrinomonadaceae bacterium]